MNDSSDVTQLLNALEGGDAQAAEQLLPLLYQELRRLVASHMAHEKVGLTLQPTALVHEAYLRLVNVEHQQRWNSRGHFFGAAAEAMRRILVENARRRKSLKRGGGLRAHDIDEHELAAPDQDEDLLALNDALKILEATDLEAATVVKLRYFSGLSVAQTAEALNLSHRSTERLWTYRQV